MRKLRFTLVTLIFGMSFFFNIERLDFGEKNIINIASFVYVLGFLAIILTIAIPQIQHIKRSTAMVFWSIIYLLVKTVFFSRPVIGGVYTYLSITELAMLLALVWLAYQVTAATQDFENAVEKITIGHGGAHVKQLSEAADDIQREMFRSRHYHRPLGVISVQPNIDDANPDSHRIIREAQEKMVGSYIINNVANTLQKFLRPTDVILEDRESGRFYIICPETPKNDLKVLLEYVEGVTAEELGVGAKCGFATFPDEAVVFEDLLQKSVERLATVSAPTDEEHKWHKQVPKTLQHES